MSSFTGTIDVRMTKDRVRGRIVWELLTPISYYVGYEGSDEYYTIPAGTRTDGASVPWGLRWLIEVLDERTFRPTALHDYLLENRHGLSRARIDGIFKEALEVMKVGLLKRWLMWTAVRIQSKLNNDS